MNYREFRQQFERIFQEKAERFPSALSYLRNRYKYVPSSALSYSVLEYLSGLADRDDAFWSHFDGILADILQVLQISPEQLLDAAMPSTSRTGRGLAFPYEAPSYPLKEHLYYLEFEPALERERFLRDRLPALNVPSARFCDVGFGPGVLLSLVLKEKPDWQGAGIDISSQCAQYAEKLLSFKGVSERIELIVADVRRLPFADALFDVVVAMEVLEHIPNPFVGLSEVVRILKPGGSLLSSIPVNLSIPEHLCVFSTTHEVLALYQQVGLHVLSLEAKKFGIVGGLGGTSFTDTFAWCLK